MSKEGLLQFDELKGFGRESVCVSEKQVGVSFFLQPNVCAMRERRRLKYKVCVL